MSKQIKETNKVRQIKHKFPMPPPTPQWSEPGSSLQTEGNMGEAT